MYDKILLSEINPYIRFVNNYSANYSHVQPERIIYDYEFMYILKGSITIYYDARKYILEPADLFYFCPGIVNHMETDASTSLITHCIHFDWTHPKPDENFKAEDFYLGSAMSSAQQAKIPLLCRRYTPAPLDFTIPTVIKGLDDSVFRRHFSKCYASFLDTSPLGQLRTKQYFWSIISDLYQVLHEKEKPALHPKARQAIQYIDHHYTEEITTEKLAASLSVSPKYFGTLFKEGTGKTVSEYVHSLRMYNARQMLIGSNASIHEIAFLLGYTNEFYFSNKFKQSEGVSPLKYREDHLY